MKSTLRCWAITDLTFGDLLGQWRSFIFLDISCTSITVAPSNLNVILFTPPMATITVVHETNRLMNCAIGLIIKGHQRSNP